MIAPDLDRLIDIAAEQLVDREPSSSLTDAVMARVRALEGSGFEVPGSRFWFLGSGLRLSSGAAAAVLAILLLLNFVFNTPPTPTQVPASHGSIPSHPTQPVIAATAEPLVSAPIAAPPIAKRLADRSRRSLDDDSVVMTMLTDDPLVVNPIAVEPIEIAPIALAVPSAEQIQIEPLIIEPISLSND
jgi:hypothetical protein